MILRNARLVLPDRSQRGSLRMEGGKISALAGELSPAADEEVIDLAGQYLAPGFIDLHIHGALRRDTMEATSEAFDAITRHQARGGTTALCLTTVVATADDITRVLDVIDDYRQREPVGARVLGAHIEGPYF